MPNKRVIIVGGGFGGLNAGLHLRKAPVDVLIMDKTNHHVFQPLLYQIASAALSPGNIASPIREIVAKQENTSVVLADVTQIDKTRNRVITANGDEYAFDYLILAPGASHSYFGNNQWETFAPGLKTINDAVKIREKILLAFEFAERCDDPKEIQKLLRFIIIGGGPTGCEMAGAIAEIATKTMFRNFRKIRPELSEIILIEGVSQILPSFPESLGKKAQEDLEKLGVKVMLNTRVTNVTENGVYIGDQLIEAFNVIWAAGNQAAALLATLGTPIDKAGRAIVESDQSIPGYPHIFVIGDAAQSKNEEGNILPGIAPVAIQQGRYVAGIIRENRPVEKRTPFHYWDKGMMATTGKNKAVAKVGKMMFSGFLAWIAWGLIHIAYLINFRNRFIVMFQWAFLYIAGKRNVRLITNPGWEKYDRYIKEQDSHNA